MGWTAPFDPLMDTAKHNTAPMSQYIDGFVIPMPKENIEEYRRIAEVISEIWMEHGAVEYRECVGDDLDVGRVMPFPRVVDCAEDETVIFGWIVFWSREHRDAVSAKVMQDTRLRDLLKPGSMPFDPERMVYGGFESLVKAQA